MTDLATNLREYDTLLVASASSGMNLGDNVSFDQIHEFSEFIMGHPIWTHEFAETSLWLKISEAIRNQIPDMPKNDGVNITPDQAMELGLAMVQKFGPSVSLVKGFQVRTENPLDSLTRVAPGKSIIGVVQTDD